MTEGQEKALLSFLRFDRQYKCYYDEILILLKTGLRISEFCGLTVSDLVLRTGLSISTISFAGKPVPVFMLTHQKAEAAIGKYQ